MTMQDTRRPEPGTSDFGNWQKPAVLGLMGLNPVLSVVGLILILGAGGVLMFFGFLATLVYVVVAVVVYGPLAIKVDGRSMFARLIRRATFVRGRRARRTAYLSGPLSPQPGGRFRLPGLLAATRLFSSIDAYGSPFAFMRVPVRNSYAVCVRASADGDALVDPSAIDAMVGSWSGFLQMTPQYPDLKGLSVTIESVPDPGHKIGTEVERMRTAGPIPDFTAAVMGELQDAATVGSPSLSTRLALVFDGGKGSDRRDVDEMATEIGTQLPDIIGGLAGTGAGAAVAMTADEVCETTWAAFHPDEASELDPNHGLTELDWSSAGPTSANDNWDHYRHDSGISVSWLMEGAPRGTVRETIIKRLLEPHAHLPRKRVTIYYRPLTSADAAAWADRQTKAIASTPGQRVAAQDAGSTQAKANAADEARGAAVLRFAVVTTITVTNVEQLARARKAIRNLHAASRLVMREAYGQQAAAFSAGLGLGILLPDHVTLPKVITE